MYINQGIKVKQKNFTDCVRSTMSLRGATRRGNLPEGNPVKAMCLWRDVAYAAMHLRRDEPSARCGLCLSLRNTTRCSIPCSAISCQFVCLVDTFYNKNKPDPCQQDTFRAFFQLFGNQTLICSRAPFLLPYRRKSSFRTNLFCKASLCRSLQSTPTF